MSDDDLYTTSKKTEKVEPVVESKTQTTPKKKRVQDDFFAFNVDDVDLHKPKKKKKKVKKVEENTSKPISRKSRPETKQEVVRRRDVTPPPSEIEMTRSSPAEVQKLIDQKILDAAKKAEEDLVLEISEPEDFASHRRMYKDLLKLRPGLKDHFKLTVNLSAVGHDSSLELLVRGSSRVEKILKVAFEYMKFPEDLTLDLIMVFQDFKLPNTSQICTLLTIDKNLQKDSDGYYNLEVHLVGDLEFQMKRESRFNSYQDDSMVEMDNYSDIEIQVPDEKNSEFDKMNIHELEKLAAKSLRMNSLDAEPIKTFKITLKASEKSKLEIDVSPEMGVSDIRDAALKHFNLKDCKLVFDDEELDPTASVKDTELEDDFIVDVVNV